MREYEEYERGEEMKARGQVALENLREIFEIYGGENVASLARSLYKYTDCGAALGVLVYRGNDLPGDWVHGSDLRELPPDAVITALSVSSIVEGVDQTTDTHVIDLFDATFETPAHAAAAYGAAVARVEAEAKAIWNDTHGCPTCAKHFGNVAHNGIETCEGDDGITPVWDDCPECGGGGSII